MDQSPSPFPPPPDPQPVPVGVGGGQAQRHPLDFERILQLTFSLYRFAWRQYLLVGLVLYLPLLLTTTALQLLTSADLIRAQQAQLDYITGRPVALDDLLPVSWVVVSFVSVFVVGAAAYIVQGGLVQLTASTYSGQAPSARAAIRSALGKAPSLIGAGLLSILATLGVTLIGLILGTLLILANVTNGSLQPGLPVFAGLIVMVASFAALVLVTVRLAFVPQAVMLESHSATGSLVRSWRLVAGSGLRVLSYSIAYGLLTGVVALVLDIAVGLVAGSGVSIVEGNLVFDPIRYLLTGIVSALITVALVPIGTIALTLLFYDVRFRRDSVAK